MLRAQMSKLLEGELTMTRKQKSLSAGPEPRSLHVNEWPAAHQRAWEEACKPSIRLKRGGAAAHLAPVSQQDIANRYDLYLDFLARQRLDFNRGVSEVVTPANVGQFMAELDVRVRSVTVWNSIYKLRRAAQLMEPASDFSWLVEIEKDVAVVMQPRNKAERLVLAHRLLEAGLALIYEAGNSARTEMQRARAVRNGLMIALLALHPLRIKNFGTLRIGSSIKLVGSQWWLSIRVKETKSHRLDERRIPDFMTPIVDRYVKVHRPILFGPKPTDETFWVSSTRGGQFTVKNMGTLISRITLRTVGVDVSPHLFRMAAASTAAIECKDLPYLAAGVLGHRDRRTTEEHYIRHGSLHAGAALAEIVSTYRSNPI
jgi:integrase